MTLKEFLNKIQELKINITEREVTAHFDFPIHGKLQHYKISSFNKDGSITLRNDDIVRPVGHE